MTPELELEAIRAAVASPAAAEWGPGDRLGVTMAEADWEAEQYYMDRESTAERFHALLRSKAQLGSDAGFTPLFMPSFLMDFQLSTLDFNCRAGRSATLLDCGMGKTVIAEAWSENVVRKTDKPVLILTPLSVANQFVKEGEKFGIEVVRSKNGERNRGIAIYVTNYERLHHFDPSDFGGVVCDEASCFPPNTKIETSSGMRYIKDVLPGDSIASAWGYDDTVIDVTRKRVENAIVIKSCGVDPITSSPNHPYFTNRGWVEAKDIRPGDRLMETTEAMRLVRQGGGTGSIAGRPEEVLRSILLSEMENVEGGVQIADLHPREARKDNIRDPQMVGNGYAEGSGLQAADCRVKPDGKSGHSKEGIPHFAEHEVEASATRRERTPIHGGASVSISLIGEFMDTGTPNKPRTEGSWISDMLQAGLGQPEYEGGHRSRRIFPSIKKELGPKEGSEAGYVRVESVEVLESGHPDLERHRDADGFIYFYDLEIQRHPSFSVNGVLVHNCIKAFNGSRRAQVTEFLRTIPYRLMATATAAPNDYIELGTLSEALGVMGQVDMLNRFFRNDRNTSDGRSMYRRPPSQGGPIANQWRFKGHSEIPFWRWVCSWARAGRKPSDLGPFDNGPFVLPKLIEREHIVSARTLAPGRLFEVAATNMHEEREERRRTITERCEMAAALVSDTGKPFITWCQLNPEGELLERLMTDAVHISGADSDDQKEEKYEAFLSGQARGMISKQKIGGWGLNCQHCPHVVEFADHSFEAHYQGVRRCWRFGQKQTVINDMIATEGQRGALDNMRRKSLSADSMFSHLIRHMNESVMIDSSVNYQQKTEIPAWL